eukprot:m.71987 g.71987  ORF g.71987 m.71987 type:complete len:613 (+) comp14234_c0_seq1:1042-2880(+)
MTGNLKYWALALIVVWLGFMCQWPVRQLELQVDKQDNDRELFNRYVNHSGEYTESDFTTFQACLSKVPQPMMNRLEKGIPHDRNPIRQCGSNPTASFDMNTSTALNAFKQLEQNPVHKRKGRVAVVGAGIAGLQASFALSLLGYEVYLYEASNRTGGRLLTYYFGKAHADMGAMRFSEDDLILNYLAEKVGVARVPFTNQEAPSYLHYNGIQTDLLNVSRGDLDRMKLTNVRDEYVQSYKASVGAVLKPYDDLISAFPDTLLPFAVYAALGDVTEMELLRAHGLTEDEVEYATLAGNTACYARRTSGTDFMVDSSHFANPDASASEYITMQGGMSNFTRAVEAALPEDVHLFLNHRITSINVATDECSGDAGPMEVCNDFNGVTTCKHFDGVIMTVPVPMMAHIDFDPPLPMSTERALRSVEYDESTKVALPFTYAPWDESQFPRGTIVMTDLMSRQLIFQNNSMVYSYTWGHDAEAVANIDERVRVDRILQDIAIITNTSLDDIRRAYSNQSRTKSWKTDQNIGGAFTLYGVGNYLDVQCGLTKDVDENPAYYKRLRTTGEHKDAFGHAWIETSLISAIEQTSKLAEVLDKACPGGAGQSGCKDGCSESDT